jgi:hypothetical protein
MRKLLSSTAFWRSSTVAVAVVLVGVLVGSALGAGSAVTAETASGNAIKKVVIVRSTSASSDDFNSGQLVDLPGANGSITVPAGKQAILLLTFSGESVCFDGDGWCKVNILVNGVGAKPNSDFAFDSTDGGAESDSSWESHGIQRSTAVLGAGSYTVKVRYGSGSGAVSFRLDDWQLTIERVAVP